MPWPRRKKPAPRTKSSEYASGLEEQIAEQLKRAGIPAEYETLPVPFTRKITKYYPDWVLPNGIVIETKGWFQSKDRSKHLLVQEQHPDLDIRFVFSNSRSRIGKKSTTTYGRWCESKGFKYADLYIPPDWLKEPPNERSLAAIARLKETKTK